MKNRIHIVVIDTGLSEEVFFRNKIKCKGMTVIDDGSAYSIVDGCEDCIGHGSAVMQVFYQYSNDCEFTVISAYDMDPIIAEEKLLFILKYIYENISCDIINISGGITMCEKKDLLRDICDNLAQRGNFIVSAFDNLGAISYPACMNNVIGVDGDMSINRNSEFYYVENSIVNIIGFIRGRPLVNQYNEKIIQGGTSFLAPYISCLIAGYMQNGVRDWDLMLKYLKNDSVKRIIFEQTKSQEKDNITKYINKAIVFPFNKEIEVMCRNADLLQFKIGGVFDSKYLGKVGKTIMYETSNYQFEINDIDNLNWKGDFDSVILGHIHILEQMTKINIQEKIVEKCLKFHKNLYMFDCDIVNDDIITSFKKENIKIFFPQIKKQDIPVQYMGKQYMSVIPSIGVFGTSSKQGKYTIQLGIRRELLKRNINVAQLGTEPTAYLFGMESIFTIGYNAQNDLNEDEKIIYLNSELKNMEEKNPDIIIFGSQSHTIPIDYSNVACFTTYQQSLLFAVRPDICVLCVNVDDSLEYVKRTIMYLETISETKVLAVMISPISKISRWTIIGNKYLEVTEKHISDAKQKYSALGLEVLEANKKSDIGILVDKCIEYLTD